MEVTDMIYQFMVTYGWKLTLIACSGIFVVGIIKFFKIFDFIEKDKRKPIYIGCAYLVSLIGSMIYLIVIGELSLASFGIISSAIYTFNQVLYSTYESIGLRNLVRKAGEWFIHFVANNEIEKAKNDIINDIEEKEIIKS